MRNSFALFVLFTFMLMQCTPKPNSSIAPSEVVLSGAETRTVADVLRVCFAKTENRFAPALREAGLSFPPKNLSLLVFKEERILQVYTYAEGKNRPLVTYPVLAMSGKRGPKQQEGDKQVPEGLYKVEYLNPNSQFHVSFKINYPNVRDVKRAQNAGIANPGTDIFIHGKEKSIGCVAIGDWAIEELFTLVALTGSEQVRVLIFPNDARSEGEFLPCEVCPKDIESLYAELLSELEKF